MPLLQFKGKTAIETYHHTVPHHALEFDEKLSVLEKGERPSLEGNLIIEGDNLLALKALLPTHAGKIKCIYIDPPYNTGNEGWIYNDNLSQPQFKEWIGQVVGKEEEDACRHDKWCCMMYPRLSLLKQLLTDDGVIAISIDDHELPNLLLVMDEIFGEDNFITSVVWKTRNTDNRVTSQLSVDHEYLVIYTINKSPVRGRVIDRSDFDNPDNDPRGDYVTDPLTGKATADERPNLHHIIVNPKTGDKYKPDPARGWITDRTGIEVLIKENLIWWPQNPATGNPRKKRFLSQTSERMPASSFWGDIKGQSGADEVDQILGKRLFAFPKSVEFMRRVLDLIMPQDATILDSTAGSGTTAHAVLQLNKTDKGNRKFVLIQQPYDSKHDEAECFNICRNVTSERIRRVIAGYKYEGAVSKVLLEERIGLNTLKNSSTILERIEKAKKEGAKKYDEVETKCEDGVVRVFGTKQVTGKTEPLGGMFSYVRLSQKPILGEYRDITKNPPSYEEIAKYVYYTETSSVWDKKGLSNKTGKIGEHHNTSLYLLYTPNQSDDQALDVSFLNTIIAKDKNPTIIIYCEKIWIHRSELLEWSAKHKKTIRPMIVPFNLK